MRKICISLVTLCCTGTAFSQVSAEQALEAAVILGVNAETLACADITGPEVTALFDRLSSDFADFETYRDALASSAAAYREMTQARAVARLDSHDPQAASTLAEAEIRLAAAQAEADRLRESLVLNLTDSLSASSSLALSVIECPLGCSVPPAYRPAGLSSEDRRTLAWALRMREYSDGGSLPADAAAAIRDAEAVVGVQLAILRRDQFAAANEAAIGAWMDGRD